MGELTRELPGNEQIREQARSYGSLLKAEILLAVVNN